MHRAAGPRISSAWPEISYRHRPVGRAVINIYDGSRYSGAWSNDLPNGSGVFTTTEGVIFETAWTDGIPHGKGVLQDADGKIYAARWRNGQLRTGTLREIQD